jgi:hypothetical protein
VQLIKSSPSDFTLGAFRTILRRDPDPAGALDCILHLEAGYPRREILAKMLLSEEGQRNARSFPGRSLLLFRYRVGQMFRWLPFVKARRLQRDRLLACLRRAATAQAASDEAATKAILSEQNAEQLGRRASALEEKLKALSESTSAQDRRLCELSAENVNLRECLDVLEKRHLHALVENMMLLVSRQSALEIQLRQKLPSDAADIADLSRKLRELASVIEAGKPRG